MSTTTSACNNDPHGLAQVSGFYGPGGWAAWLLALISMWIGLVREKRRFNHDHITHLIYTNWAAIDLLRQLKLGSPSIAPMTAAIVVNCWAILHGYAHCYILAADGVKHNRASVSSIVATTTLGTILPSVALLAHTISFFLHEDEIRMQSSLPLDTLTIIFLFKSGVLPASITAPIIIFSFAYIAVTYAKATLANVALVGVWCLNATVSCLIIWGYRLACVPMDRSDVLEPICCFLKPCSAHRPVFPHSASKSRNPNILRTRRSLARTATSSGR